MEKPIIGITTGDLNGIGLEIIIKIFSDNRMLDLCTPVIFTSNKAINYYRRIVEDHPFNFASFKHFDQINTKQVNVFNCWEEEVNMTPGALTEVGGKYALRSLMVATQCLKDGQIDAIVTAPMHKKNTHTADFPYTGHTPYFKEKFEAKDVVMMLYNDTFKVALVTEHMPLSEVAASITADRIIQKAQLIKQALIKDFGIAQPKIAILGLNPHASDDGLIGTEEQNSILPAVEKLQQAGVLAFGPYSADAFFAHHRYQQFDVVLAMYHDQGLIPFKSLTNGSGVNYTCGLPVVRTSPDHGVAFDIAGKNLASPDSMREAVYEAIDILSQRAAYAENTANPLQRQRLAKER